MNFTHILSEIETIDPEVYEKLDSRRSIFKNFGSTSKKITMAALPFAIGSLFQKAYGQTTTGVAGVLNFALQLEYLESNFYIAGLNSVQIVAGAGGVTSAAYNALAKIRDHENTHVTFLKNTITTLGGTPVSFTAANFDFTAKGTFPDVMTNYDTFLAVAQAFEDTGVRAYKGQAGNLQGTANRPYLTAALNIHSVEARHASHIRQMRFARGVSVKPYITGVVSGIGAATNGNYLGEDLTVQGGVDITKLNGVSGTVTVNAATECFDEPLTKDAVLALVGNFFK
ncbi:MAG: ferritin-like domain-containing protein [Deinococcales bacterium]|nr:ferritin-like domain-containing protein [Chitinophagaceae bacterium]